MLSGFAATIVAKLVEKLVAFVAKKILEFVEVMQDESERKKAVEKAKQGDNTDLENLLRSRPA